jgi:hypothetical protein
LAALSCIAGNILDNIYCSEHTDLSVYETYLQQLEEWAASLPAALGILFQRGGFGPQDVPQELQERKREVVSSLRYLVILHLLTQTVHSAHRSSGRESPPESIALGAVGSLVIAYNRA